MYSFKNWIEIYENNLSGKDYIVGDLHGHYTVLMDGLEKIGFNDKTDRLFCVGDLVDRGPEVGLCLSLLKEKWFFSVLGNHEYMLLTTLGQNWSFLNTFQSYLYSDRRRVKNRQKRSFYLDYLDLIKEMPFAIKVEREEHPFHIFHAQRPISKDGKIWTDSKILEKEFEVLNVKKVHNMLWSRKISREAIEINHVNKHGLISGDVVLGQSYINGIHPFEPHVGITYCGHTTLPEVLFHKSHIFIDGGKYKGGHINIIDHHKTESLLKDINVPLPSVY